MSKRFGERLGALSCCSSCNEFDTRAVTLVKSLIVLTLVNLRDHAFMEVEPPRLRKPSSRNLGPGVRDSRVRVPELLGARGGHSPAALGFQTRIYCIHRFAILRVERAISDRDYLRRVACFHITTWWVSEVVVFFKFVMKAKRTAMLFSSGKEHSWGSW